MLGWNRLDEARKQFRALVDEVTEDLAALVMDPRSDMHMLEQDQHGPPGHGRQVQA